MSGGSQVASQRTALFFSGSRGSRYVKLQPGVPFFGPDIQQMTSYLSSINNAEFRDETTTTTTRSVLKKTRDPYTIDDAMCVVCQDDLHNEKEKIDNLKCGHKYHHKCLSRWLLHKKLCPLCREDVWIKIVENSKH